MAAEGRIAMEKGSGLTEVMITVFLSSLIAIAMIQLFLSHKRQYQQHQYQLERAFDLNRIRELMRMSVIKAGFTPCLPLSQLTLKDNREPGRILHDLRLQQKPYPALLTARMSDEFIEQFKILGSRQLWVKGHLNPKRPLIIADCFQAEIHQIESIKPYRGGFLLELEKPLSFSYSHQAYLGEWVEERWFVRENVRGKKALYFASSQSEELSSFVQRIHFKKQQALISIELELDDGHRYQFFASMRNG